MQASRELDSRPTCARCARTRDDHYEVCGVEYCDVSCVDDRAIYTPRAAELESAGKAEVQTPAPCAHCGCSAYATDVAEKSDRRYVEIKIKCHGCSAQVSAQISWPNFHRLTPNDLRKKLLSAALAEWDSRPEPAETDQLGEALAALRKADAQMAVARRFLPTHGGFGEEGINDFEDAQSAVISILASATGGNSL